MLVKLSPEATGPEQLYLSRSYRDPLNRLYPGSLPRIFLPMFPTRGVRFLDTNTCHLGTFQMSHARLRSHEPPCPPGFHLGRLGWLYFHFRLQLLTVVSDDDNDDHNSRHPLHAESILTSEDYPRLRH